jgi:hypothetical protein
METDNETQGADPIEQGGCACGAARFRVKGAPRRVSICHCMTCRRVHGSAFGAYAMFARTDVELFGTTRVWQSSSQGRRHFCEVCGSVAFMEYLGLDEIDLPLGAFDRTGLYEPTYELWCCRREPWLSGDGRTEYRQDRPH